MNWGSDQFARINGRKSRFFQAKMTKASALEGRGQTPPLSPQGGNGQKAGDFLLPFPLISIQASSFKEKYNWERLKFSSNYPPPAICLQLPLPSSRQNPIANCELLKLSKWLPIKPLMKSGSVRAPGNFSISPGKIPKNSPQMTQNRCPKPKLPGVIEKLPS